MIKIRPTEIFKEIKLHPLMQMRYAISNHARLIKFTNTFTDGELVKINLLDKKYRIYGYTWKEGKKKFSKNYFIRRLVAEQFCPRTSVEQQFVLSLDFNAKNDLPHNLKWATRAEMLAHQKNSPFVKRQLENLWKKNETNDGKKLTTTQAIRLKKLIFSETRKTRYKILAKQFGVSEMQIYRMKRGEIWGHIKV